MAITITLEDGTGVADANSYVDPAGTWEASYLEAHLYADLWTAATTERQKASVVQATRTIDSLISWKGRRVDYDQALEWPRYEVEADGFCVPSDEVPRRVREAVLEMALALLERNRLADQAVEAPVTKLGLGNGALELELGADPAQSLPAIPRIVQQLLAPYGFAPGGLQRIFRA